MLGGKHKERRIHAWVATRAPRTEGRRAAHLLLAKQTVLQVAIEVLAVVHKPEGMHIEVRHGQWDEGSQPACHSTIGRNGAA